MTDHLFQPGAPVWLIPPYGGTIRFLQAKKTKVDRLHKTGRFTVVDDPTNGKQYKVTDMDDTRAIGCGSSAFAPMVWLATMKNNRRIEELQEGVKKAQNLARLKTAFAQLGKSEVKTEEFLETLTTEQVAKLFEIVNI